MIAGTTGWPRGEETSAPSSLRPTILVTIYHLLRHGTTFHDLGSNYFDPRDEQATFRLGVHRIERLRYTVVLEAA